MINPWADYSLDLLCFTSLSLLSRTIDLLSVKITPQKHLRYIGVNLQCSGGAQADNASTLVVNFGKGLRAYGLTRSRVSLGTESARTLLACDFVVSAPEELNETEPVAEGINHQCQPTPFVR